MCCLCCLFDCFVSFFFFKQKTAYEMRISDWSSDVCSSDLDLHLLGLAELLLGTLALLDLLQPRPMCLIELGGAFRNAFLERLVEVPQPCFGGLAGGDVRADADQPRPPALAVVHHAGADLHPVDAPVRPEDPEFRRGVRTTDGAGAQQCADTRPVLGVVARRQLPVAERFPGAASERPIGSAHV